MGSTWLFQFAGSVLVTPGVGVSGCGCWFDCEHALLLTTCVRAPVVFSSAGDAIAAAGANTNAADAEAGEGEGDTGDDDDDDDDVEDSDADDDDDGENDGDSGFLGRCTFILLPPGVTGYFTACPGACATFTNCLELGGFGF